MGYAFISYSARQRADADRLRSLLQSSGIDTWMAPHDIPAGADYPEVINSAIENAACMVLLLTHDAQSSTFVDKEIERALHYGKTIAPIQLGHVELNDSFAFYLCNQQIATVTEIAASPKMETLLNHLHLLCNDQLPPETDPSDAARDKRVRRRRAGKLLSLGGFGLMGAGLLCGHLYRNMAQRITFQALYGTRYLPQPAQLAAAYVAFFLLGILGVCAWLYGRGLLRPGKQGYNPFRILPKGLLLPAFSLLCAMASVLLGQGISARDYVVAGLTEYEMPAVGYELPGWMDAAGVWLWALCAGGLILSLILFLLCDGKNGFARLRGVYHRLNLAIANRKRGVR